MIFIRSCWVVNPETYAPMLIDIWKKWTIERPEHWVGETWVPSWMTFTMAPNTQYEMDFT